MREVALGPLARRVVELAVDERGDLLAEAGAHDASSTGIGAWVWGNSWMGADTWHNLKLKGAGIFTKPIYYKAPVPCPFSSPWL